MSDSRLRDLEREATNDPVLRPRLLVERVRAGELRPERLRLAAEAGSVDARRACGWPEHSDLADPTLSWIPTGPASGWRVRGREEWVRELASIERWAGMLAALAASKATAMRTLTSSYPGSRALIEQARRVEAWESLAAVEDWARAPAEERERFRERIPGGMPGRRIEYWTMLALTARAWDRGNPETHSAESLPTGARTVRLCCAFLEFVIAGSVIDRPMSEAVSRWALRSETAR